MDTTHFDRIRRWLRLTTRGGWLYALLMPWLVLLISYGLMGLPYGHHWQTFVGSTFISWLFVTITFISLDWAANAIAHWYPKLRQTVVRAGFTILAFIGLSGSFLFICIWFLSRYQPVGLRLTDDLSAVYGFGLIAILLLAGIYETSYFLYRWQQHEVNREKLKKENLQGQLQGLKSQVNPHFLFNSLNSLSSLIADEPQRAEQFVDQMAQVYRYILQPNRHPNQPAGSGHWQAGNDRLENGGYGNQEDDELTTLDRELAFIESYYHLLKTRYGAGLQLTIAVPGQYGQRRLPPHTLQLLVENAVKHNVILASRPLSIDIMTTERGYLLIRNNLQRKNIRSGLNRFESTQAGLVTIQAKYHLLDCPEIAIQAGPDYFTVTLPLLTKTQTNA